MSKQLLLLRELWTLSHPHSLDPLDQSELDAFGSFAVSFGFILTPHKHKIDG